jgi:hypothetical protein
MAMGWSPILTQKSRKQLALRRGKLLGASLGMRVFFEEANTHHAESIFPVIRGPDERGNGVRVQQVVRIQEQKVLSPGRSDAGISGRRQAPVVLVHVTDAGSIPRSDRLGVVIGPVVDDDGLDDRIRLIQDTFDRGRQEMSLPVARNDHGY